MLEIGIFFLAGIIIGTFTGLTPGIHTNTINSLILSSPIIILATNPLAIVAFVVSLATTHSILDIIPSIFLGAPNEESYLTTLPGHEMLREGRGIEAVYLSILGILLSIPLILLLTPIFTKFLETILNLISFLIPFILIFLSVYLISRENYSLTAISVFIMSGILGYCSLNTAIREPLLPLLSGLFGGSGIILSLKEKTKIPPQKKFNFKKIIITKKEVLSSIISASIFAPLFSFLPAIGAGHAATFSTEIFPQTRKSFLITINCINLIVNTLSFVTLYTIGKTRTGASVAVKEILNKVSFQELIFIISISIITLLISTKIAIKTSVKFGELISKINYRVFSIVVLIFLILIICLFSGFWGIIIFLTGSAIGIFCIESKVRRINLMACLILPTILIYLF